MLELKNDQLVFRFPEVHPDCVLTVTLHRTLRLPDDGREYPLPPSLGRFPSVHIDDHKDRVPKKWTGRGGIAVPLWQSEALWVSFDAGTAREHGRPWPFAVKVAAGKVSAITGKKWSKKLRVDDYCVIPLQKWIDGFVTEDGTVRQFVAQPLGLGATVEAQITGKEEFGGMQLEVVPMSAAEFQRRFPKLPPVQERLGRDLLRRSMRSSPLTMKSSGPIGSSGGSSGGLWGGGVLGVYSSTVAPAEATSATNYSSDGINVLSLEEAMVKRPELYSPQLDCDSLSVSEDDLSRGADMEVGASLDMGLGAGGRMKQQIFKDSFGIESWDKTARTRVYVHMSNSLAWRHLTGREPPTVPLSAADYTRHGYPWFHHYSDAPHVGPTPALAGVKSVAQLAKEKGLPLLPENLPADVKKKQVLVVPGPRKGEVRSGSWAK